MNRIRRIIVAAVLCCGLSWSAPLVAQTSAMAWTRWETQLTAIPPFPATGYTNAYKNVLLRVNWTCVSNCNSTAYWSSKMTTYGYWDGGLTFRIRAAFPQPVPSHFNATWQWSTTCSSPGDATNCANDSGLNKTGTVTVTPSTGSANPLYRGGAFGMQEDNFNDPTGLVRGNIHFYNDLGPFYWQGDTAWNAPILATFNRNSTPDCATANGWTTNDWKCYVADRVAKNFTAVQISVPQSYMANPLVDRSGNPPFLAANWEQWNPAFWQAFEDKVQWANEQGLVVLLVGLMEPSHSSNSPRYPTLESDSVVFARNVAARLGGNFVIFSPGFDTKPDTLANRSRIRAVGNVIHTVSPRPVIVNHFGGQTPVGTVNFVYDDYADFNNEVWLDTNMFQSGQARTLREDPGAPMPQLQLLTQRARQMPRELRLLATRKGSANVESIYDYAGLTFSGNPPVYAPNYTPYRVRHTAYLSTLSGAFGYSMGVGGLFDWGLGVGSPYAPRTPRNSVGSASATQIRLLGNLFRAHRWDFFAPEDLILNNPTGTNTQHLQMVLSRDLSRRSTLAYLPDNNTIQLSLSTTLYPDFATARWTKRWFNPKTGAYTNTTPSGSAPTFTFTRPTCGVGCNGQNGDADWVLELLDTTAGARLVSKGPSLQAFATFDDTAQSWSITGQLVSEEGAAIGDAFAISDATSGVQRLPLITRANGGEYVVVWEAEDLDGDRTGIFARRIGANGKPAGDVQRINDTSAGRQFDPVLTSDASGAVTIAWTDADPQSDTTRIVSRRLSSDLAPLGAELVLSSTRNASRRSPLITADAAGNFAVAWQEHDPLTRTSSIIARRVSANGRASAEQIIESDSRHSLILERLDLDATGNLRVLWQQYSDGTTHGHYTRGFDAHDRPLERRQRMVGREVE